MSTFGVPVLRQSWFGRAVLVMACVAGLSAMAGCDVLGLLGSAAPIVEDTSGLDTGSTEAGDNQAALPAVELTETEVLGRVVTAPFPISFFVTVTQGATIIVDHAPVTLHPIAPVPPEPVVDRAAAVVATDPQDGRVWYDLPAAPLAPQFGTNTQLRVAVRSVPDPNRYLHSISFYVRATRPGTDQSDLQVRGEAPLFNFAAGGDLALTIQGMRIYYGPGIPCTLVDAQPPAEFFPAALPVEQQPVALFMRSGDVGFLKGSKFIHLAHAIPNIIDATQNRPVQDGGVATGSGLPTVQVNGWLAFQNTGLTYSFINPGEFPAGPLDLTTAEFTRIIHPAAYTLGVVDPDASRVYYDASLPITVPPNAPGAGAANDVFELGVNTIVVCVE